MNDEIDVSGEEVADLAGEPVSSETEEVSVPVDRGSVEDEAQEDNYLGLYEDYANTQEITVIDYRPVLAEMQHDLSGLILFGAFMICGVLVALRIMEDFHFGTR